MSWNVLLPLITTIAGTSIASNANNAALNQSTAYTLKGAEIAGDAAREGAQVAGEQVLRGAEITRDATLEGAQIMAAGLLKASNEVRAGYESSFGTLDAIRADGAGGTAYLRGVVNEDGSLTPVQRTQLDDLRRSVTNQIRGSSLAGSGRTVAELFKKAETDFVNSALEANKNRAFTAATTLHGNANQAGMQVAQNQVGQGRDIGNLTAQIGQVQGQGTQQAGKTVGDAYGTVGGLYGDAIAKGGQATADAYGRVGTNTANAGTANANLMGKAIGDIGSVIANEQRQSKWDDRMSKIEKSLGIG